MTAGQHPLIVVLPASSDQHVQIASMGQNGVEKEDSLTGAMEKVASHSSRTEDNLVPCC